LLLLSVGDITVGEYQCDSEYATTFTLILVAYKALLTGIGALIAFKVRSLGTV
jgi:hypothetical protein